MEKRDPLKEVTNTGSSIEPQGVVDNASKPSETVAQPSENKENGFFLKGIHVSECPASPEEQKVVKGAINENDLCELFNNLQVERAKKSQEILEEKSNPEFETENKELEGEESVVKSPSLQLVDVQSITKLENLTSQVISTEEYNNSSSKQEAEFLNEFLPASSDYTKLKDTGNEKQEHVKEQIAEEFRGSPQKVLESDSEIEIKSSEFLEKLSEPDSATEQKKLEENLELEFKTQLGLQESDKQSASDDKKDSEFEQKPETFQTQLPLDVETSPLGLICKSEIKPKPLASGEVEQKQLSSKFEVKLESPEEKLNSNSQVKCRADQENKQIQSDEIEQKQLGSEFEKQIEKPLEKLDSDCEIKFQPDQENKQLQSGEIEQEQSGSTFEKEIQKPEEQLSSGREVKFQRDQESKQSGGTEQEQSGSKFEKEIEKPEEKFNSDREVTFQPDQESKQLQSGGTEQEQSTSKFEKEIEKPEEKFSSDCEATFQPDQESKQLQSGGTEQEQSASKFEKEIEKPEEKFNSDREVTFQPDPERKQLQSGGTEQEQSGSKLEKKIEKPEEKFNSDCEVTFQPNQENKHLKSGEIEQKQSGLEFDKEIEKPDQKLDSDCQVSFHTDQENKQLKSGDIEQKQSGLEFDKEIEKPVQKLDFECQVSFHTDQENKQLQSGEIEQNQSVSEFVKRIEKPEENLDYSCEVRLQPDQENNQSSIHSELNCEANFDTEQKSENLSCEIENSKTDEAEIESSEVNISNARKEISELHEAKPSNVIEVIPDNKTEELGEITTQTQETIDETTRVADSDITYINQDDEHHLDSGVDSIEESYTKSPKSLVDFEESERGGKQDITSEQEVSDLPEKKLDLTHDRPIEESLDQITSDEESKIDNSIRDETPQLVDEPAKLIIKEDTKLVKEPDDSEEDGTIVTNLTDNKKSDLISSVDIDSLKTKMADLSEKLSEQQQENSDLKLQLNAIQQAKASLELEIRQKEEIIIKTQAEALKNEQTFKQEIKQLREKLKENSKLIEKDGSKELEDQLKEAKVREAKAIAELNQKTKDDLNYQKIMEEYENTIATRFADFQKLKEEHDTATRHLANIELAFSDVHQKYERAKALLEGFKSNEETLKMTLQAYEKTGKQHEERYESLKAHAKGQIEKSNKEILMLRDKYEVDVSKLKAIIKRLEIKCSSLQVSLQQKTEECAALSALCDEVTGKKV